MGDWIPREEWVKTQPQALVASCVMLLDDQDRMLLLRYGPGQEGASGTWWLPGGMVDEGENPWPAARREIGEETGITLGSQPRLIGIDHRANVLGTGPVVDYFFAARLAAGQQIQLSPEHDRHAFHHPDDLPDLLAAHRQTLTTLHAAALAGRAAYLQEGMPA
ncbi:NUDIX hydrolase [Streptomyces sp. NBC_00190]|uniref:NUDIX hydrolase n=1 Tax=unclassified Streptomyces TaxID=2593676 RepID=UPI002E2CFBB6|nr:NUDIX hydrolase [Streptomyces sp. NBC_00190]WSZ38188.1 NUDIX hydrolase [Streptomyces sp. NBC_00868]